MHTFWWQLPGPQQFLSGVVNDLRDGKNVVLCLPEHPPEGFQAALNRALSDTDGWLWNRFTVDPNGKDSPAAQLFARFVPDASPETIFSARTLIREPSFTEHLIWLDGLTPSTWRVWKDFLEGYTHLLRSVPQFRPSLFVVPLIGDLIPPAEDVCLSVQYWRGCVRYFDMLLFASGLLGAKHLPDLHRQLAVSATANVALWDPAVAVRLAAEDIKTILAPQPVLREIAIERGWEMGVTSLAWYKGTSDSMDGRDRIHSAILAADGNEIGRRIWRAQVSVLFPYIEECRQDILGRLGKVLRVPYQTPFGTITNIYDLEIGHIDNQIKTGGISAPPELCGMISRLREIRNALAHSETLDSESALAKEIL